MLKDVIGRIKADPNAYWIGLGDYIEGINISDKRFDPFSVDPQTRIEELSDFAQRQARKLCDLLMPIRDKCLGLGRGNHEEKLRQSYYNDAFETIRLAMKAIDLDWNAIIRLKFGSNKYYSTLIIHTQHGSGGGRKVGAMMNKMEEMSGFLMADIHVVGHSHKAGVIPFRILKPTVQGKLRILERQGLNILCGGMRENYRRGIVDYADKMFYYPTALTIATVTANITLEKIGDRKMNDRMDQIRLTGQIEPVSYGQKE